MVAEAWCGHLCRVKANQGAVVRAGRALDSELVGELPTGAEVRVWESGFHLKHDGTKIGRCRVTEPLNGWLSAKCVEVLPQGVRGGPVPRCAFTIWVYRGCGGSVGAASYSPGQHPF